jgi:hypothetical protein
MKRLNASYVSKIIVILLLSIASFSQSISVTHAEKGMNEGGAFKDAEFASPWAKDSIQKARDLGIFSGDSDGNFRPKDSITRQEIAKVIALTLGIEVKEVESSRFSDVDSSHWGMDYIEAVANGGIMQGGINGTFRPNDSISREELAVVLVRALKGELESSTHTLHYEDKEQISSWAKPYVAVAFKEQLMMGTGKNFNPKDKAQRQEAAVLAIRISNSSVAKIENINSDHVTINGQDYNISEDIKGILNSTNLEILVGAKINFELVDEVISSITYLEITANGVPHEEDTEEFSSNVVLNGNGAAIDGDLKISANYVSVLNLTIRGKLEITEKLENDFYSNNLTVLGDTVVNGGDENTVVFESSNLQNMEINKLNVHVQSKGITSIQEITVTKDSKISAEIESKIPKVTLIDGVNQVELNAPIEDVIVNSDQNVSVTGTGDINNLKIENTGELTLNTKGKISNLVLTDVNTKVNLDDVVIGNITLPEGKTIEEVITNYEEVKDKILNINGTENTDSTNEPDSSNDPVFIPDNSSDPVNTSSTPSATQSSIVEETIHGHQGENFSFNVRVKNSSGEFISGLTLADFQFTYQDMIVQSVVYEESGRYRVVAKSDILVMHGEIMVQAQIKGVMIHDSAEVEISPQSIEDIQVVDIDQNAGVDSRDFYISWTPSPWVDVTQQSIYIIPVNSSTRFHEGSPVAVFNNNTASEWHGTATLTLDSEGNPLTAQEYMVHIMAENTNPPSPDEGPRYSGVSSGIPFTPTGDQGGGDDTTLTVTSGEEAVVTEIRNTLITVVDGTTTAGLDGALTAPTGGSYELQDGAGNPVALDTIPVTRTMVVKVTAEDSVTTATYTITAIPAIPDPVSFTGVALGSDTVFNIADQAANDEAVQFTLPKNDGSINDYKAGDYIQLDEIYGVHGDTTIATYTLTTDDITTLNSGPLVYTFTISTYFDAFIDTEATKRLSVAVINGDGKWSYGHDLPSVSVDTVVAPTAVTDLSALAQADRKVTLSWTNNVDTDFAMYKVYYAQGGVFTKDSLPEGHGVFTSTTQNRSPMEIYKNNDGTYVLDEAEYSFVLYVVDDAGNFSLADDQTVTVFTSLSSANDITGYSFTEQTGTATIDTVNHTVDIEVANGTDVSSLVATFTTSASVQSVQVGGVDQVSGKISNNFTSPVTYTVTAEDGTQQTWTVTVSVALSSDTMLTVTSGEEAVVTEIRNTLITVADGTTTAGIDGALTAPTGGSYELQDNAGNPVILNTSPVEDTMVVEVTAEDGVTTATYTITAIPAIPDPVSFTGTALGSDTVFNIADQAANDEAVQVTLPQNDGSINDYKAGDYIQLDEIYGVDGDTTIATYTLTTTDITTLNSEPLVHTFTIKTYFDAFIDTEATKQLSVAVINGDGKWSYGHDLPSVTVDTIAPTVTGVSIADGSYKVGDPITVTITADAAGYTAGTITVNGVATTGFTAQIDGTYTVTYTVQEGDTDRAAVGDIPISVVLNDTAGNANTAYTTAPIAASSGTVTIDANSPTAVATSNIEIKNVDGANNDAGLEDTITLISDATATGIYWYDSGLKDGDKIVITVDGETLTYTLQSGDIFNLADSASGTNVVISVGTTTTGVVYTDSVGSPSTAGSFDATLIDSPTALTVEVIDAAGNNASVSNPTVTLD